MMKIYHIYVLHDIGSGNMVHAWAQNDMPAESDMIDVLQGLNPLGKIKSRTLIPKQPTKDRKRYAVSVTFPETGAQRESVYVIQRVPTEVIRDAEVT
jgi:hypothetical protein